MEENWLRQEGREFFWLKRKLGSLSLDRKRFITYRNKEHFFRKFQGFGFSKELINKLIALNVEFIVLFYKNTNGGTSCYKINPQKVRECGIPIKEKYFEGQKIVPISEFEKV